MVCKYCKKPLPDIPEEKCPHCFAVWTAEKEEKEGKKTKTEEYKTVNGHD